VKIETLAACSRPIDASPKRAFPVRERSEGADRPEKARGAAGHATAGEKTSRKHGPARDLPGGSSPAAGEEPQAPWDPRDVEMRAGDPPVPEEPAQGGVPGGPAPDGAGVPRGLPPDANASQTLPEPGVSLGANGPERATGPNGHAWLGERTPWQAWAGTDLSAGSLHGADGEPLSTGVEPGTSGPARPEAQSQGVPEVSVLDGQAVATGQLFDANGNPCVPERAGSEGKEETGSPKGAGHTVVVDPCVPERAGSEGTEGTDGPKGSGHADVRGKTAIRPGAGTDQTGGALRAADGEPRSAGTSAEETARPVDPAGSQAGAAHAASDRDGAGVARQGWPQESGTSAGAARARFEAEASPAPPEPLPEEGTNESVDRDSAEHGAGDPSRQRAGEEGVDRRGLAAGFVADSPGKEAPDSDEVETRTAKAPPDPLRDVTRGRSDAGTPPAETAGPKAGVLPGNPSATGAPEPSADSAPRTPIPVAPPLTALPGTEEAASQGRTLVQESAAPRETPVQDPTASARTAPPSPKSDAFLWQFQFGERTGNAAFRNWVHLNFQDAALGRMRWQIHLGGGRVTAETVVESARVQSLLQSHQGGLENRLNAMNLEVTALDVSVDQDFEGFASFSDRPGEGASALSGQRVSAAKEDGVSLANEHRSSDATTGLDVYA